MFKKTKKFKAFPEGIPTGGVLKLLKKVCPITWTIEEEEGKVKVSGLIEVDETSWDESKKCLVPVILKKPFSFQVNSHENYPSIIFMEHENTYGAKAWAKIMTSLKPFTAKKIMLDKDSLDTILGIAGSSKIAKKISANGIIDLNFADNFFDVSKLKFPYDDVVISLSKSNFTVESNNEIQDNLLDKIESEVIPYYVEAL